MDELPILHRYDVSNYNGDYYILKKDLNLKNEFNNKINELFSSCDYKICAVVLDKKTHLERYGRSARNPYSYLLDILLERYIFFLRQHSGIGDVMAEARGKKNDRELKNVYRRFYKNGTQFVGPQNIQSVLTSNDIKIKEKIRAVAGLEMADLLTLATKFDALKRYSVIKALNRNFQENLIKIIEGKYLNDNKGDILGYGLKLIK